MTNAVAAQDAHALVAEAERHVSQAMAALAAAHALLDGPHLVGAARLMRSLDGISDEIYALGVSL